jgi:hypothetical protein
MCRSHHGSAKQWITSDIIHKMVQVLLKDAMTDGN